MNDEAPNTRLPIKGANFWIRFASHLVIDLPLVMILSMPVLIFAVIRVYGVESLMTPGLKLPLWWHVIFYIVVLGCLVLLLKVAQATPGKKLFRLRVVDAKTGGKAPVWKLAARGVGYLISSMPVVPIPIVLMDMREVLWVPLGLGFFWILIDKRNRGWHDMLSGTLTVSGERDHQP